MHDLSDHLLRSRLKRAYDPASTQINPMNVQGALQAFNAILDSASLSGSDQKKLTALVQIQQNDDADEDDLGSPAAAAYKTHSSNILDALEDLKEKTEGQLSDPRKAKVNTKHDFNILKNHDSFHFTCSPSLGE